MDRNLAGSWKTRGGTGGTMKKGPAISTLQWAPAKRKHVNQNKGFNTKFEKKGANSDTDKERRISPLIGKPFEELLHNRQTLTIIPRMKIKTRKRLTRQSQMRRLQSENERDEGLVTPSPTIYSASIGRNQWLHQYLFIGKSKIDRNYSSNHVLAHWLYHNPDNDPTQPTKWIEFWIKISLPPLIWELSDTEMS